MSKQKFFKIFAWIFIFSFPLSALGQALSVDSSFNANKLIDDKVFSDTQTFGGAAGIQKFLSDKHSVLANTDPVFLVKLKEPQSTTLKQGLDDPEPSLGRLRTAAELIWDVSESTGINPQVILVTMEKEQSLIDGQFSTDEAMQTAIDHAMGFNCGDNVGCWNLFPGFYYQLFGNFDSSNNRYLGAAKSLMKSFITTGGRGPSYNGAISHVGDTIILDNTLGGYEGIDAQQTITIANSATAALYRYTPHVFNGNYNFWKFFNKWFKYPNGTLLRLASASDTYIIQNGLKALVPQFVAQARNLKLDSAITISPTEFASYDTDKPLGPVDNTVVAISGQNVKYVFINNIRHQASDLVLSQRGLTSANVLSVSAQDASVFETGSILTPKDGTIIRGTVNQAVYLVQNGQIKLYSAYTFAQNKIKAKQIVTVPDDEILTYTQNGFVAPLDGSLIKTASSGTVYVVKSGLKQPVAAEIFKNQGYSYKNIATISNDELNALAEGPFATPKDKTFFAQDSKTGPLYEFKDGTMHSISSYVAKQRGIKPDYVFAASLISQWYNGIPIPPRDGTLLKGDSDGTVYVVQNGQLDPLSAAQFKAKHYSFKNVVTLAQAEIDSYAKTSVNAQAGN